jgi:nucleotide-binding universal stress UspA family protein
MNSVVTNGHSDEAAGPAQPAPTRLLIVVGFDGTDPARRALEGAVRMLHGRTGLIEVVFVGHVPSSAAFRADALVEVKAGLDLYQKDLAQQAADLLAGGDVTWHFQRRDGEVARELLAAGHELLEFGGPDSRVVLVVGGSAHKIDRYLNSVPSKIVRQDHFSVVVIP